MSDDTRETLVARLRAEAGVWDTVGPGKDQCESHVYNGAPLAALLREAADHLAAPRIGPGAVVKLAREAANGWACFAKREKELAEIARIHHALDEIEAAPRPVAGTWPPDYIGRAFVDGARWWQFHHDGATAFPSEVDEMETEAVRRYGQPPLPEPPK